MWESVVSNLHLRELTSPLAILDILLLAVIIYQLLILIRGTRAFNVLMAIAALFVFYLLSGHVLQLRGVHAALERLLSYVPFAIIVLFQSPIRKALANLGKSPVSLLSPTRPVASGVIEELTLASASLASKRTGALIAVERGIGLRTYADTGIKVDGLVSYDLLMNLFMRRSPLHDGAVIIVDNRIQAASAYLPLTTNPTLSREYGTRHRAAAGLTEETDAVVIVVSEERGEMSISEGGRITPVADARALRRALEKALHVEDADGRRRFPFRWPFGQGEGTAAPARTEPSDA